MTRKTRNIREFEVGSLWYDTIRSRGSSGGRQLREIFNTYVVEAVHGPENITVRWYDGNVSSFTITAVENDRPLSEAERADLALQ